MKKLSTILATVLAAVLFVAAPVAASTGNTGTYGPAEEPGWILPAVGVFVLICAVAAFVSGRSGRNRPLDD